MTSVGTRHDAVRLLIAVAAATGLAVWFGDRVGVEGDDLAIIEGATHFDLKPRDGLYRFAWQPLSYFLAHGVTQMGLAPLSLTYLPNILGGAGLVLLAETLRRILRTPGRTWMAYAVVLAVPELWITILYFNTTALGLPFFCASLFLLCLDTRDERAWMWNIAAAAVLYALACSFRLDFTAASLVLLLIVYCRAPSRAWLSVSVFFLIAAASGLTILTSLGVGPSDLLHIVGDFETHPWQAWQSVVVFALAILPLILMSPFLLGEIIRRPWPRQPILFWPALALCALPMLYPLISLYSAKYLIPAFCVGLVGLAFLLRALHLRFIAGSPLFQVPTADEFEHWDLAGKLAAGNWLGHGLGPYFRPQLFAYFLALLHLLTGGSLALIHLFLANEADLRTESSGEGPRRCVVVYPKNYSAPRVAKPFGRRR